MSDWRGALMLSAALLLVGLLLLPRGARAQTGEPQGEPTNPPSPAEADATEDVPPPPVDAPPAPPAPTAPAGGYDRYPGQPAPGYGETPVEASEGGSDADVVPTGPVEPTEPSDPDHRGFFIRPLVGFGYASAGGQGIEIRGLAFSVGVMIGAAVAPNVILFGEFGLVSVGSGDYEGPGLLPDGERAALVAAAFGGGVAYYVMPLNLHLSLSGDYIAMQLYAGERPILTTTDGFGFQAMLGKEWRFTRRLGVGVSVRTMLGFVGDYTLFNVGVAGTFTFN